MRSLLTALAALLVLAALTPAQAAGAEAVAVGAGGGPAHYRYLPAQVFTAPGLGSIAVGMPNQRTVKVQHRDPTTGGWDRPSVLYRTHGRVTCGAIDGRGSTGGIALLLECDKPYYDDQAPAHSVALVSQDLRSWRHHRLPGEAYKVPAIAPGGRYAAWLAGDNGAYVEWSTDSGFGSLTRTTYDFDSGGETVVVDDSGTVDIVGPEPSQPDGGGSCVVGVHTRDLAGTRTAYLVPGIDPGCTEGGLDGVDADTVTGGGDRASTYVISRPDAASPFRLTQGPADQAPGLVLVRGGRHRVVATAFQDVRNQPLMAFGSPDRQHVYAQVFDDATRTWAAPVQVLDAGRPDCRDPGNYQTHPWPVFAYQLRCGRGLTVIAGATPTSLQPVRVGSGIWTISATGALAAPDATGTTIVTTAGTTHVATAVGNRPCDVVYAVGQTSLVRIHAAPGDAWPVRRQTSVDGSPWRTTGRITMPEVSRCHSAKVDLPTEPTRVILSGHYRTRLIHRRDYLPR